MKIIQKIAILRANALGDFLVTLPAIEAIRHAYPEAELVLFGKPWHKQFLKTGRTPIDRVIVVPVMKGIREEKNLREDEAAVRAFFYGLQKEYFDIALHFQGNGMASNAFINRLNADLTVGLTCEKAPKIDKAIDYYYTQSEVLRFLEVTSLIGAAPVSMEPSIKVLEEDREEIRGLLSMLNEKPFVVLHPFATDIRRAWPYENYVPLADWFQENQYQVVFTGSSDDYASTEDIISNLRYKAFNACGTTSVGGLAALLAKAHVVIGADTGPIHLARAVKTPTVGLYWAPNLINWGPLTRKIHRPVVSWTMACPFCGTVPNDPYPFEPAGKCDHQVSFVRDIGVGEVIKAASVLLFPKKSGRETENIYTNHL